MQQRLVRRRAAWRIDEKSQPPDYRRASALGNHGTAILSGDLAHDPVVNLRSSNPSHRAPVTTGRTTTPLFVVSIIPLPHTFRTRSGFHDRADNVLKHDT